MLLWKPQDKEEATRGMRNLHKEEMHDWYFHSKLIQVIK
jgi:hypothetical protein